MKRDKRGRVRFTVDSTRYEFTKNGITIYRRDSVGEMVALEKNQLNLLRNLMSTEEGRAKMSDALIAVDQTRFTNAVHIPAHMKAVNS